MLPRVTGVEYLDRYRLLVRFDDGTSGTIDFEGKVSGRGGVFAPLEDIEYFQQVSVDRDAGTLVWPNGVDFCPDDLYLLATGKPTAVLHEV